MISLTLNIANPFSERFENVYNRAIKITEHKSAEFEVIKDNSIISFVLKLTTRQSHGGIYLSMGLLGWDISFQLYDNRHWNSDTGQYYSE
jgi:hypothetical protein